MNTVDNYIQGGYSNLFGLPTSSRDTKDTWAAKLASAKSMSELDSLNRQAESFCRTLSLFVQAPCRSVISKAYSIRKSQLSSSTSSSSTTTTTSTRLSPTTFVNRLGASRTISELDSIKREAVNYCNTLSTFSKMACSGLVSNAYNTKRSQLSTTGGQTSSSSATSSINNLVSQINGLARSSNMSDVSRVKSLETQAKSMLPRVAGITRAIYESKISTAVKSTLSSIERNYKTSNTTSPIKNFCDTARCSNGCDRRLGRCNPATRRATCATTKCRVGTKCVTLGGRPKCVAEKKGLPERLVEVSESPIGVRPIDTAFAPSTDFALMDIEDNTAQQAGFFGENKLAIIGGLALVTAGIGLYLMKK